MNNKNALLLVVIALGAIAAFKFMAGQMVPYVPFAKAAQSSDYVQIMGSLDRARGIEHAAGAIRFTLVDTTATSQIRVEYAAEAPLQLESAEKIVAMGKYDKASSLFKADQILTKCPSKYEKKKQ